MEKVLFIYNPRSGQGHITGQLDGIVEMYQNKGYAVTLHRLDTFEKESYLAGLMNGQYHHIMVSGGDGTVNYVVNILLNYSIDVPLAVIPAGTANDFARMLVGTDSVTEACRRILNGTEERIDVGKVNGRYFVNVLSAGLFTDISQKTPTAMKNTFGKLAYYMNSLQELPGFRPMKLHITSEDGKFKGAALVFFVFNGKTAGNLNIAHNSSENDGLLDVVVVKTRVNALKIFIHFLKSGKKGKYPRGVEYFQTPSLRIECEDELKVDLDGEHGPSVPIDVECVKGALRIIR